MLHILPWAWESKMTEERIDRIVDLKGELCPFTFIRSKLALEDMEVGEILRVVLDDASAVSSVPESMQLEGQQILRIRQVNDTDWEIVIRKNR